MSLTKKLIAYILLFFSFILLILYFIYNFFYTPSDQEKTQYQTLIPNKEIETDVYTKETKQSPVVDSKDTDNVSNTSLDIQQMHSDMLLSGEQNAYGQYGGAEEIIISNSEVDSAEDNNGVIDRELDNGSEIKKMGASDDLFSAIGQEVNKSGLVEEKSELYSNSIEKESKVDSNLVGEESVVEKNESYSVKQAEENEIHYTEEKDKEPEVGETEFSAILKTVVAIIGGIIIGGYGFIPLLLQGQQELLPQEI